MTYREILGALEDCEQKLRANEHWRQQFFVVPGGGTVVKPEKAYLTVEEVATYLGVHRKTIYKKIKSGRFEGVKFGPHWLIKTDSI